MNQSQICVHTMSEDTSVSAKDNIDRSQVFAVYNVYRLVQLLDRIPDPSKLPPMTKPTPTAMSGLNHEEDYLILSGIYENYRERRQRAIHSD